MMFRSQFLNSILLITFLTFYGLVGATKQTNESFKNLKNHPGHGKRFGSQGPFLKLEELNELDTKTFFDKFVKTKTSFVLRGQAKKFPAYKLWTDEYMHNASKGHEDLKLTIETRKKESREQGYISMSLKDFLNAYKSQDIYMVSSVPYFIRKDVSLPQPLQCGIAPDSLEEAIMWFSSGGTSSVVHTDDYENLLCILDGVKELVLVSYNTHQPSIDAIIDEPKGSYSSLDVDNVDYESFPELANIEYYYVNLTAGDCLYIPFRWLHQVRSYGRNLAINFWFNNEKIFGQEFPEECSQNTFDVSNTLDKHNYTSSLQDMVLSFKYFLIRLVNNGNRKLEDWKRVVLEIGGNQKRTPKNQVEDVIKELFDLIDFNGDGIISNEEIVDMDQIRLEHTNELFEEIYQMFDESESNEEGEEDNDDENSYRNEL